MKIPNFILRFLGVEKPKSTPGVSPSQIQESVSDWGRKFDAEAKVEPLEEFVVGEWYTSIPDLGFKWTLKYHGREVAKPMMTGINGYGLYHTKIIDACIEFPNGWRKATPTEIAHVLKIATPEQRATLDSIGQPEPTYGEYMRSNPPIPEKEQPKTRRDWFNTLPEPIRDLAFKNTDNRALLDKEARDLDFAVGGAFLHSISPEKGEFWSAVQAGEFDDALKLLKPTGKIGEGEPWFDRRATLAMNEQNRQNHFAQLEAKTNVEKVLAALKVYGSGPAAFISRKTGLSTRVCGYTLSDLVRQKRVTVSKGAAIEAGLKVNSYGLNKE